MPDIDAALSELIPPGTPFALLGISGDGEADHDETLTVELGWLKRRGARLRHLGAVGPTNWLRMERRVGAGLLLLHGGGSFGDVFAFAHDYREAVLWRYRGRQVIQLPQPLRFSSQAAISQTARVIERHGAFTLLVSDAADLDLATRGFACEVRMCPPLALALRR